MCTLNPESSLFTKIIPEAMGCGSGSDTQMPEEPVAA
jgi:hypothetical protein